MSAEELIRGLSDPAVYADRPDHVEVRQTHISLVFLAGAHAYKLKKAVRLGFLDFSTLERRRWACDEEVRLNRRLAPDVYLGVVAVLEREGRLFFHEAAGPAPQEDRIVEWAVKMRRLDDHDSMLAWLARGALTEKVIVDVALRLAEFHEHAARDGRIASFGSLAVVGKNARENLEEVGPDVGVALSAPVHQALRDRTEELLGDLGSLIEKRQAAQIPCDGHGDLRLEHVYIPSKEGTTGSGAGGTPVIVIDCVEFNERFRMGDPVLDIAFLAMELRFYRRDDLARAFVEAYLGRAHDEEGRALLPFYVAYRSIVRGKVRALELREAEIPAVRKSASLARARAHFLLALGILERPERRPALVLMGGLPGTGKSTLAKALSARAGFDVIRSDVVRTELFPEKAQSAARAGFGAGLYAPNLVARTYADCLARAEASLFSGGRVIIDATFAAESERQSFVALARSHQVPLLWLVCRTDPERARARLARRTGDASHADIAIYERARGRWEPPGEVTRPMLVDIDTDGSENDTLAAALRALADRGLFSEDG